GSLELRLRMDAGATWTLTDGNQSAVPTVAAHSSVDDTVIVDLARADSAGKPIPLPTPRLTLTLQGAWRSVEATVDLPCPSEAALRAEVIAEIDEIFRTWFERGIDDVGPRRTGFLAKSFDAVTGE